MRHLVGGFKLDIIFKRMVAERTYRITRVEVERSLNKSKKKLLRRYKDEGTGFFRGPNSQALTAINLCLACARSSCACVRAIVSP